MRLHPNAKQRGAVGTGGGEPSGLASETDALLSPASTASATGNAFALRGAPPTAASSSSSAAGSRRRRARLPSRRRTSASLPIPKAASKPVRAQPVGGDARSACCWKRRLRSTDGCGACTLRAAIDQANAIRYLLERVEAEVAKRYAQIPETVRTKEMELGAEERRLANFVDFIGEGDGTQALGKAVLETERWVEALREELDGLRRSR